MRISLQLIVTASAAAAAALSQPLAVLPSCSQPLAVPPPCSQPLASPPFLLSASQSVPSVSLLTVVCAVQCPCLLLSVQSSVLAYRCLCSSVSLLTVVCAVQCPCLPLSVPSVSLLTVVCAVGTFGTVARYLFFVTDRYGRRSIGEPELLSYFEDFSSMYLTLARNIAELERDSLIEVVE